MDSRKKLLLRVLEAGEMAGCGRSMAYELARNGTWETVQTPYGRRVVAESVERWVQSLREETSIRRSTSDPGPER